MSKPLVFLHLPKTAGVTVRSLISLHFSEQEIGVVPDREAYNAEYILRQIETKRFVHGHLSAECIEPVLDRLDLITFVRHPVSRIVSTYRFLRKLSPHHTTDEDTKRLVHFAQNHTLEQFVQIDNPIVAATVRNLQAGILSGHTYPSAPLIDKANQLLSRSRFVGIQDRFDDSMTLLNATMGWPPTPAAPRLNSSSGGDSDHPPAPEVCELIAEMNRADFAVYEHACRLFQERLAQADITPRSWRSRVALVERYRGRSTAAGTRTETSRPLLANGWLDLEGQTTAAPWRFAAPSTLSCLYCILDFQPRTTVWSLIHLPFFARGITVRDIHVQVNDRNCDSTVLNVAQGNVIWMRTPNAFLERDGMQCFSFDSGSAQIPPKPVNQAVQDDRPIRFALTQILHLQFSPEAHPRFTRRLRCFLEGLAEANFSQELSNLAQGTALEIKQLKLRQPVLSSDINWCTPEYQKQRFKLLEGCLPFTAPATPAECLQELKACDPTLLAEILFVLFPHIESV